VVVGHVAHGSRCDERREKNGTDPAKLQEYFANLQPWQGVAQMYFNQKNGTNNLAHSTVLVKFKPGTKDFEQVISNTDK